MTELDEITHSEMKPADRLRASDKLQVIKEFLYIIEDAVKEDDND